MLCWHFKNPEPINLTNQQNKVDISGNFFILWPFVFQLQSYVNYPDRMHKKHQKSQNVLITKTEADT